MPYLLCFVCQTMKYPFDKAGDHLPDGPFLVQRPADSDPNYYPSRIEFGSIAELITAFATEANLEGWRTFNVFDKDFIVCPECLKKSPGTRFLSRLIQ
jgi:hypothetical protein